MIKVARLSISPKYFRWNFPGIEISINGWIKDREHIHDSDFCGESKTFWVVMNDGIPTFYRSIHTWNWHNYGQEDSHLENEFEITEIDRNSVTGTNERKNLSFVL